LEQLTVLAGVPNEYAPQLVSELRSRQLVNIQPEKRKALQGIGWKLLKKNLRVNG